MTPPLPPIARARAAARASVLGATFLAGGWSAADATDWPQWRGPARNGVSSETGWLQRWPVGGPRRAWAAQVGAGFSAVSVAGGRAYTLGHRAGRDTLYCFDAATGRQVWSFGYPAPGGDYEGPRATPCLSGGRVYWMSRDGQAYCVEARSGRRLWSADLRGATGAEEPRWGFAGSPLVQDGRVIFNLGGNGTAVDAATGRIRWKSGGGPAGYASPVRYQAGASGGVALFTGKALVSVDAASGRRQWEFPWNTSYDVNAADPVFHGDHVFITSGYGRGGALIWFGRGRPVQVWQTKNMKSHFSSPVYLNDFLYGNDDGALVCLEFRTGAQRWRTPRLGKGGLIAADGKLLALTERGDLVLAAADPTRYTELARTSVLRSECWTHPVLANGYVYCRSRQGEVVCLDLRGQG